MTKAEIMANKAYPVEYEEQLGGTLYDLNSRERKAYVRGVQDTILTIRSKILYEKDLDKTAKLLDSFLATSKDTY